MIKWRRRPGGALCLFLLLQSVSPLPWCALSVSEGTDDSRLKPGGSSAGAAAAAAAGEASDLELGSVEGEPGRSHQSPLTKSHNRRLDFLDKLVTAGQEKVAPPPSLFPAAFSPPPAPKRSGTWRDDLFFSSWIRTHSASSISGLPTMGVGSDGSAATVVRPVSFGSASAGVGPGVAGDKAPATPAPTPLLPLFKLDNATATRLQHMWAGLYSGLGEVCTPTSSKELRLALESPTHCRIIVLPPASNFLIESVLTVNSSKVLVGSPVRRAVINATESNRAIRVMAGGSLDIRHITLYPGDGDRRGPRGFMYRVGGSIYVHVGANLRAFDCTFTMEPWREMVVREEEEYMLGGDVCIEGGVVHFVACNMYVIVTGFINDFSREVGGSVLLLGGLATFTGVNFMTTQIFAFTMGFGMHVTIWGGIGIFTGCTHTANLAFSYLGGGGRNIFIGGGVAIITGTIVTDTMAFLAFWGLGLSVYVLDGLSVATGTVFTLNNAISEKAGAALAIGVSAGLCLHYGVVFYKNLGISAFHMVGVFVFLGSGVAHFIDCPFMHQNAIMTMAGAGGAVFVGSGEAVFVQSPFMREYGITDFHGLGGDVYVGSGALTMYGVQFLGASGIEFFDGQGEEIFFGHGIATLTYVTFHVALSIQYKAPWTKHIFVSGEECDVITGERVTPIGEFEHGEAVCPTRRRALAPLRDRYVPERFASAGGRRGLPALADSENGTVGTDPPQTLQTAGSEAVVVVPGGASPASLPDKVRRPVATSLSLQHVRFNPRVQSTSPPSSSSSSDGMRVHVGGSHVACDACGNGDLTFEGPGGSACQSASQAPCPPSTSTALPAAYSAMGTETENATAPGNGTSSSSRLPAGTFVSVRTFFLSCRNHQLVHKRSTLWGHKGKGPCGLSPAEAEAVLKSALEEQAKGFEAVNQSTSQVDPYDDAVKWQVRHDDSLSRFAAHWGLGTRGVESPTSTSTSSSSSRGGEGEEEEEGILAGAVRLEGSSDDGDYTGCPVVSRFVLRLTSFDHVAFEALQASLDSLGDLSQAMPELHAPLFTPASNYTSQSDLCWATLGPAQHTLFVPSVDARSTARKGTAGDATQASSLPPPVPLPSSSSTASPLPSLPMVYLRLPGSDAAITRPTSSSEGGHLRISVADFSDGARVQLQLISSPSSTSEDPLIPPPLTLHVFRNFDGRRNNASFAWTLPPAYTRRPPLPGVYYLRAIDAANPGFFAFSQAFEVRDPPLPADAGDAEKDRAAADGLLTRLGIRRPAVPSQGRSTAGRRTQHDAPGTTGNGSETPSGWAPMDVPSLNALMGGQVPALDLWTGLLQSDVARRQLGNATSVRLLMDRVPVLLDMSPKMRELMETNTWNDRDKVEAASTEAITNFLQAASKHMTTKTQTWSDVMTSGAPPELLDGMRQGKQEDMDKLMDIQAAQHFGGATLSKLRNGTGLSDLKKQLLQDPMGMADFFGDDAHVAAALGL